MTEPKTSPRPIPALLVFPESAARLDAWGKLLELSALGARLETRCRLAPDERLVLSFELAGEPFSEVSARVTDAEADPHGYCIAGLHFTDETQKRRLSRLLLDVLSRA